MSLKYSNNLKHITSKRFLLLPLVALFVWNGSVSFGQGLGNAPYSVLGLGEVQGDALSGSMATGNAGVASSNGMQINNLNPALWVRNRYTTFEFGGIAQFKRIEAPGSNQADLGANIGFLAIAFPVNPKWTTGLSLKPYSYIDYSNSATGMVAGTVYPTVYNYSGKGAVNKVAFTNGFQIGKYVSLGLEAYYLFGNVRQSSEVTILTGDGEDNTVGLDEKLNMKNFSVRGGAAVRIPVRKDNKLFVNLGGTYSLGNDLAVRRTSTYVLTRDSFPLYPSTSGDTLEKESKGHIGLPSQYRVGASLEWPFLLTLSADYEYTNWTAFKSYKDPKSEQLSDVGRFSFGAEYIPKMRSTRYWDLIAYRAGINFGQSPYTPNGNQLNETNISLGLGLPIGRGASTLSLAFVGGQRGVLVSNAIRERYVRMVLAWSFTDLWFVKQKID